MAPQLLPRQRLGLDRGYGAPWRCGPRRHHAPAAQKPADVGDEDHAQPAPARSAGAGRARRRPRQNLGDTIEAHVQCMFTLLGRRRAALAVRQFGDAPVAGPQICDPALRARFNGEPAIGPVCGGRPTTMGQKSL